MRTRRAYRNPASRHNGTPDGSSKPFDERSALAGQLPADRSAFAGAISGGVALFVPRGCGSTSSERPGHLVLAPGIPDGKVAVLSAPSRAGRTVQRGPHFARGAAGRPRRPGPAE